MDNDQNPGSSLKFFLVKKTKVCYQCRKKQSQVPVTSFEQQQGIAIWCANL